MRVLLVKTFGHHKARASREIKNERVRLLKTRKEHYRGMVRREMREVDWRKPTKGAVGRKEGISQLKESLQGSLVLKCGNAVHKKFEILRGSGIQFEKHVMFI